MKAAIWLGCALLVLAVLPPSSSAEEALLLLKEECFRCHNPEKRKGGLAMTSLEDLQTGGDSGLAALVPGNPGESFLLETLDPDADPHMPPKEQFTSGEIAVIRDWIESGALWNAKLLEDASDARMLTLSPLPPSYRPVTAMALSSGGDLLAVGRGALIDVYAVPAPAADTQAKTPAMPELRLVHTLKGHQDAVQSLAWHPGGVLVSGGYRRILVWDLKTAGPIHTLTESLQGRITALEFSNGDQIVVADSLPARPGQLHIIDTKDWTVRRTLESAHSDAIFDLALSPDGTQLASASADQLVKLWDIESGQATVLETHTGYVQALEFSPQGDRLASAGEDLAIKVWNLETLKVIHSFTDSKPTGSVTGLVWDFDPSQSDPKKAAKDWLVAISEDGMARYYTEFVVHDGTQRSGGARVRSLYTPKTATPLSRLIWLPKWKVLIYGDTSGELWMQPATGGEARKYQ